MKTTYKKDAFYAVRPKGKKDWEIVRCVDSQGVFVKTNNTNRYGVLAFEEIHGTNMFELTRNLRDKIQSQKTALQNYLETIRSHRDMLKALETEEALVLNLIKSVGTIVDQINGDITLMGTDLEAANLSIVQAYTKLKERGVV